MAMKSIRLFICCFVIGLAPIAARAEDPLPSWNEGAKKQAILDFVAKATKEGSPDFVALPERIAVFDNDGTLWAEQPMYVQAFFVVDRIKTLAPQHPEWKTQEPYALILRGDTAAPLAGGERLLLELVMATHARMTSEEFEQLVTAWIATAKHPKTGRLFTDMVYQPMLELLGFLRANGFKTFIVSGGGIEFMRPWTQRVYGVPPEQVVGSSIKTRFELRDGRPVLVRLPELNFIDDKAGKPVGINQHIGRCPIFASGNSDGDLGPNQRGQASLMAHFGNRTRWRLRRRRVGSRFKRRAIDSTQSSFPDGLPCCADNRTAANSASPGGVLSRSIQLGIRRICQGDSSGDLGASLFNHRHYESGVNPRQAGPSQLAASCVQHIGTRLKNVGRLSPIKEA
jgi:hypothetical protein